MGKVTLFVIAFTLFNLSVFSQNDDCSSPTSLTVNATCVLDSNNTATATEGMSNASCWTGPGSNYSHSLWYSFVANGPTQVIDMTGNSLGTNTIGAVYSGSCGSLTEVACGTDGAPFTATGLSAGVTYLIMIDGKGNNVGSYCIRVLDPPTNDDCVDAVTLTVGAGCVAGFNSGASAEGLTDPSCWTGPSSYDESVWYQFQATDDSVTINFGDGSLGANGQAGVYEGSCGSLTEVGCGKGGSEVNLTGLNIGTWYYVMVDGKTTEDGTFCISAYETPPPPPPIGTCVNPRDLFVASTCTNIKGTQYDGHNNILSTDLTTGDDGGAEAAGYGNPEGLESGCGGTSASDDAYWVKFEATNTTVTFTNQGGENLDYTLYSGTGCTSLSEMDCQTINAGGNTTFNGMTVGESYYIMITNSNTSATTQRYLCLTGTAYVNPYDQCGDALSMTENVIYDMNNSESSADRSLCSGSMENNVWAYWTAPATWTGDAFVHLFAQDCACENGLQMSIYTAGASCPPNNGPTCEVILNPNNTRDFFGQFTPTAGETYYVTIDGFADCACSFSFAVTNSDVVPVLSAKISSFFIKTRDNVNQLKWKSEWEENHKNYVIERGTNVFAFEPIASVQGVGTTTLENRYSYVDKVSSSGEYYYRLKKVDYNGKVSYSKVIHTRNDFKVAVRIFPTTVYSGDKIFVSQANDILSVEIVDPNGRVVVTENKVEGRSQIEMSTHNLPSGIYSVLLKETNSVSSYKVMIR